MSHSNRIAGLILLIAGASGCSAPIEEIKVADASKIAAAPNIDSEKNDWPWWRGPNLDGHAAGISPPTTWSASENILWKVDVVGNGHATPTVVGDRVFVATAEVDKQTMSLVCFNRNHGDKLWERELHSGGFMHMHSKNSQASATPACDGQRVFTAFMVDGGVWVSAVDLDGDLAWQTKAGPFSSMHGYGSSPVLHKSLIIVAGDNKGPGYLAAIDRVSGDVVWRVARSSGASFATPIIANVAGKTQLLVSGHHKVTSYNPDNGEQIWESAGPAQTTANTMAWSGDLVFASGGYPENKIMAIRADGSGEVVWENDFKVYVPSMLVYDGLLFAVQDNGIARCFDTNTGKEYWKSRLGGDFSASPIVADRMIFVPNELGRMFVFKAGREYEAVAQNDLGDAGFASPVICGGQLFIRSSRQLYCIAAENVEKTETR